MMAMNAADLGQEIIDAVDAAVGAVDKDPDTNPDMGEDIKLAMWKAVAEAIVAHIQTKAVTVDGIGDETGKVE